MTIRIDNYIKHNNGLPGLFPNIDLNKAKKMDANGNASYTNISELKDVELITKRQAKSKSKYHTPTKHRVRKNPIIKIIMDCISESDWERGKLSTAAFKAICLSVKEKIVTGDDTDLKMFKNFRPDNDIWKLLTKYASKKTKKSFLQRKHPQKVSRATSLATVLSIPAIIRHPEAYKTYKLLHDADGALTGEILYTGECFSESTAHVIFATMNIHDKSNVGQFSRSKTFLVPIHHEGSIRKLKRIINVACQWPWQISACPIALDNNLAHKMRCDFEFWEDPPEIITTRMHNEHMFPELNLKEENGFKGGVVVRHHNADLATTGFAIKHPKIIKCDLQEGHYKDAGAYSCDRSESC